MGINLFVPLREREVTRRVLLCRFISELKRSSVPVTATLLLAASMPRDIILLLTVQMKPRTIATHRASTKLKEKGIKRIDTPAKGKYMMHSRAHITASVGGSCEMLVFGAIALPSETIILPNFIVAATGEIQDSVSSPMKLSLSLIHI